MLKKSRASKTAWFVKVARKANIPDAALCKALPEIELGQAADLGGGVFKKRLNDNLFRAIVLTRFGQWWVYEYLFAKKDCANIDAVELEQFRALSRSYSKLSEAQLSRLIDSKHFVEICHGHPA